MNELRNAFNNWWENLASRERWLVIICSIVIGIAILVKFAWQPLQQSRLNAEQTNIEKQALLSWMQSKAPQLLANKSNLNLPPADANKSLLTLMDTTLRSAGLTPQTKRLQPDGEDSVKVWLENANFNTALRWLHKMEQSYRLKVAGLNVEPTNDDNINGKVDMRITFSR